VIPATGGVFSSIVKSLVKETCLSWGECPSVNVLSQPSAHSRATEVDGRTLRGHPEMGGLVIRGPNPNGSNYKVYNEPLLYRCRRLLALASMRLSLACG
jgi:hypothetical protein